MKTKDLEKVYSETLKEFTEEEQKLISKYKFKVRFNIVSKLTKANFSNKNIQKILNGLE
jgi:hypothetical protein